MGNRTDWIGVTILDKIAEKKNVAAGATASKTYIIPQGEKWHIYSFGGDTSADKAEVEFLFSADGGSTWLNPYDGSENILRCLHITKGRPTQIENTCPLSFTGDGINTIVKIKVTNNNGVTADEIVGWFNGFIDY